MLAGPTHTPSCEGMLCSSRALASSSCESDESVRAAERSWSGSPSGTVMPAHDSPIRYGARTTERSVLTYASAGAVTFAPRLAIVPAS